MASIHRQDGRRNWYCAFTDQDGNRRFKSTGTAKRKDAMKVCQAMQRAVDAARVGRLTPTKARAIIEDTVAEILGDSMGGISTPSPAAFLEDWLSTQKGSVAPSTWKRYQGVVASFLEDPASEHSRVSALTPEEIQAYRDRVAKRTTPGNANVHLKILRIAFNVAVKRRLTDSNPAAMVDVLAIRRKSSRRPFTREELLALLENAGSEWKTLILGGLYTGLRLSDLVHLTWAEVDMERLEISISTAKTGRHQIIPVHPDLASHLNLLERGNPKDWLSPGLATGKSLSNRFFDLMASAGIVEPRATQGSKDGRRSKRSVSEVSFHSLRHTATSWLKNSGVSNAVAQDIIGHESAAISRNYTHIDTETKRQAIDRMPSLLS